MVAQAHHTALIKEWKRDIEVRRDQARTYFIDGVDILEVQDDEIQIEVVIAEMPTSPLKMLKSTVPPVTTTKAVFLPTKMDVIRKFAK